MDGFDDSMRAEAKPAVYKNITDACKKIANLSIKYEITLSDKAMEASEQLKKIKLSTTDPTLIGQLCKAVWTDPGAMECYDKSLVGETKVKDQLNTNDIYFLDKIDEICIADYNPSDQDLLNMRRSTSGAHALEFTFDPVTFKKPDGSAMKGEKSHWTITDVGGQIHERATWYEEYEECDGIVFVLSLADFDQASQDKRNANKFVEDGINLLLQVMKVDSLQGVPLVIMLNKKDVFAEKIRISKTGISCTFPEYTGNLNSPEESEKFIRNLVTGIITAETESETSLYVTQATDTQMVGGVLANVLQTIVKQRMKDFGFS